MLGVGPGSLLTDIGERLRHPDATRPCREPWQRINYKEDYKEEDALLRSPNTFSAACLSSG